MSPSSNVPIDENIFDSFKDLIKQVKDAKTELVKNADEIEELYVETCYKIVRQDIQIEIKKFIQQREQFRFDEERDEELIFSQVNENNQQKMQNLKLSALKLMKNVEEYFKGGN